MEGLRTGKVKFWHDEKGYAFIIDSEDKKEYYTYKKKLSDGIVRLVNDEAVEFELEHNCGREKNQTHAVNVKPI